MSAIGALLGTLLLIFQLVLVARAVVDWTAALSAGPEPDWSSGNWHRRGVYRP